MEGMRSVGDREGLLLEVQREAYEVVGLEEFGARILPCLKRAIGADAAFLYRSTEEHKLLPVADDSPLLIKGYIREYFDSDPFHPAWAGGDLTLAVVSRMPEWRAMLRHPLYAEHCRIHDVQHFFHVRLTATAHLEPGSVNLMLFRSRGQSDFGDGEMVTAARALPALEAAVRRCLQGESSRGPSSMIEAILDEADTRAWVALTLQGRLLWRSQRAARLIDASALPEDLVAAARQLGALANGHMPQSLPSTICFAGRDGARVAGELRLGRSRTGEPFVMVALSTTARPRLDELRARFGLTHAEAEVLGELALGNSNREIARRRSVSVATVRTHVVHVLEKLGVHSRLRAALMVTGSKED